MKKSGLFQEAVVIGFALFAVFFGAGNLIFPPYLGMEAGEHWFTGFLCFVAADAGLAIMAVMATVKSSGTLDTMLKPLGSVPAKILSTALILCVGPLVAIPRTCATTFEMGIKPLFPEFSSWIFGLIFFAIVAALTIRPTSVVDIIGKFLTPILLLTLFALCIKGFLSPIGELAKANPSYNVAKEGFLAGYQTMDVLGAVPLTIVILKGAMKKGFQGSRTQFKLMIPACLVAFLGLFLVYGGLCYLGATTSAMDIGPISQTELVVLVTELLLRRFGVVLLGLIVLFACLTTAIGLTSSAADFFSSLTKGRISYPALVLIICGMGIAISNIGISTIIRLASPVLSVIYPVFLTQLFLAFFSKHLKNRWVYRGAALGALLTAVFDTAYALSGSFSFMARLPLSSYGFSWVFPSLLLGSLGFLIPDRRQAPSSAQNQQQSRPSPHWNAFPPPSPE